MTTTTTTTMRVGRVWMGLALVAVALAMVSTMAQDLGTKGQGSPVANANSEHSIFKNPTVPGLKGLIGKLRGKGGESEKEEASSPKKEEAEATKTTEKISTEASEYDMSVAAAAKDPHHDHLSSESKKPKAAARKGHRRDNPSTTEEVEEEKSEVKGDKEGSEAVMASDAAASTSEDLDVTDAAKRKAVFSAAGAGHR